MKIAFPVGADKFFRLLPTVTFFFLYSSLVIITAFLLFLFNYLFFFKITNCFVNGVLLGLLPIIQNMECGGRPLESIENLDSLRNHLMKVSVDVLINGMCNNWFLLSEARISSCLF